LLILDVAAKVLAMAAKKDGFSLFVALAYLLRATANVSNGCLKVNNGW